MSNANEMQVAGNHYAGKYQHWDFVNEALCGCYMEGQITRYVSRWRKKNGVQDLQKALHYAEKLIEMEAAGAVASFNDLRSDAEADEAQVALMRFTDSAELNNREAEIIHLCATWTSSKELVEIRSQLLLMISEATNAVATPAP